MTLFAAFGVRTSKLGVNIDHAETPTFNNLNKKKMGPTLIDVNDHRSDVFPPNEPHFSSF